MIARNAAALFVGTALLIASGIPHPAAGQCTTLDPPCPDVNDPPAIGISPGTGGTYTQQGLYVEITWTDEGSLNTGSRIVTLNGGTVSLAFTSYSSSSAKSSGTVQLAAGSNTLVAHICDTSGACDSRSASYTYNAPPPPQAYAAPVLNLAPHNPGISGPSPFDGVASYSTPAYLSMDEPRSASLVYSSSRAMPMAFVQLDAYDNSTSAITRMRLRVKDTAGAFVTFINNSTSVYYLAKHGLNRLAAQWPAGSLTTGAHKYTVEVTTYYTDGTIRTATDTTRVIVVDESSEFGIGWGLAGMQRLDLSQSSQGILVVEADGRAVWFRKSGSSYVTPDGDFSTLHNLTTSYERRYPDGSKATFSTAGVLTSVKDRFNRTTTFAYTSGRLTSITDPAGKQITFAYDGAGKLTSITDAAARVTDVTVNAAGDLTQIVGPDNATALTATYDASHRLRTRKDVRNKTWGYAYDFSGRLAADTLPTILASGTNQRPVVRYTPWETAALVSGCTSCNRPHLDPDTLRARITDPAGNVTRVAFDRHLAPTRIEAPLSHTTTIDRNADGLPVRIVEPSGATRSFDWNGDGMVISIQQPETSQSIRVGYHPTWKSDPDTVSIGASDIRYTHGSSGQLLKVHVGNDSTVYEYHPDWRTKKITDPEGHTTTLTYQTTGFKNLLTSVVTSSSGTSRTTTYAYDSYGRTSSVTDPAGATSWLYDLMNRVTRVTDPLAKATNYAYDGMYVDTVKDASNKVFRFAYNALGQLETETDPSGLSTTYRYDVAGNVISILNRRNQQILMTPDALGRVISRTADGATTTYAYDNPNGRWIAGWNALSRDSIFYDERGRVEREVTIMDGSTYRILSFYEDEGPRDSVQIVRPGGTRSVKFSYNNALQLTKLTQKVGGVNKETSISYNDDGLPSSITYPTSTQRIQSLGYTAGHLPTTNGWTGALASLGVDYIYDSLERLKERVNQTGDSARVFTYNSRGELTGHTDEETTSEWVCPTEEPTGCYWDETTTVVDSDTYTYDAVGNRTDSATLQANSNRYQTFDGYSFAYYPDGHMSRKYKSGFDQYVESNNLGQITKVTTNGVVVNYGYNAFGERVYRSSLYDTRYYLYDGDDLALEVDGSGSVLREYTHFPGIDAPHSMFDQSGAVYFYASDYPGHVSGLFNASGNVANRYRYSPWGGPEVSSEAVSNTLRFMARERDWDSGLYYVRNRWYEPPSGKVHLGGSDRARWWNQPLHLC